MLKRGYAGTVILAVIIIAVFGLVIAGSFLETSSVGEITGCAVTTGSGLCLQKNLKGMGEYTRGEINIWGELSTELGLEPFGGVPARVPATPPPLPPKVFSRESYVDYLTKGVEPDEAARIRAEAAEWTDAQLERNVNLKYLEGLYAPNPDAQRAIREQAAGWTDEEVKQKTAGMRYLDELSGGKAMDILKETGNNRALMIEKVCKDNPNCIGMGYEGAVFRIPPSEVGVKSEGDVVIKYKEGLNLAGETSMPQQADMLNELNEMGYSPKAHYATDEYYVADYVEGEELWQYLKAHPEEAPMIRQQAEAMMSEIEKNGIFLPDLNPGNIKVTPDGRLVIIDVGFAEKNPSIGMGMAKARHTEQLDILFDEKRFMAYEPKIMK